MAMAAGAIPAVTLAQTSEVLFSHKHWQVSWVQFEDGSQACLAQVADGSESFSIWADAEQSIQLQFYADYWDFGEGTSADLEVEIDRRGSWSMTNAELYLQSVLFTIPDSDDGVNFLTEVMRGNTLHLRNGKGEAVLDYSLAGSSASIDALISCVDALSSNPSNPFN
jgi:hypothetical protein